MSEATQIERRTGDHHVEYEISQELIRMWRPHPNSAVRIQSNAAHAHHVVPHTEKILRATMADRIAAATDDAREYVVKQEPFRYIPGSPSDPITNHRIRLDCRIVLAHFEDAEVGEYVWAFSPWPHKDPKLDYPIGTIILLYGQRNIPEIIHQSASRALDRLADSPHFRRVPEGWERIR